MRITKAQLDDYKAIPVVACTSFANGSVDVGMWTLQNGQRIVISTRPGRGSRYYVFDDALDAENRFLQEQGRLIRDVAKDAGYELLKD